MRKNVPTIPLSPAEQRKFEKMFNDSVHMKHFGAHISLDSDDVVRATIGTLHTHHRGGLGTEALNGVVMAGLFDLVIGIIGVMHAHGKRSGTTQLSMSFMRPVIGNKVTAEARLSRAGKGIVFANAQILDENGVVCARAEGLCGIHQG